jgi:hypothetical protein
MVGIVPLFAVMTVDSYVLSKLPRLQRRLNWFLENRADLLEGCSIKERSGAIRRRLLSIVDEYKLRRILQPMLDESRLLSPYGIRSVSKIHEDHPYVFNINGAEYRLDYEPAEANYALFGGNYNWRGPVWFPVNYLLIESLQKFHHYLGDEFKVRCPTGSGNEMTLWEVATELSHRLIKIFLRDSRGRRSVFGGTERFQTDPYRRDLILFN